MKTRPDASRPGWIEVSGTKFRWDRNWGYHQVRAVLAEPKSDREWPTISNTALDDYKKTKNTRWNSHVIELASPISVTSDVSTVIQHSDFRIYPPFDLNKRNALSHLFDDTCIPVGLDQVEGSIPVPSHAVKGSTTDVHFSNSIPRTGLRIDCQHHAAIDDLLAFFLRITRQYSKQWWVSSPDNPFDKGLRLSFEVNDQYTPRDIIKYRGAEKIESTWYGAAAAQGLIGFEIPVTPSIWSEIGDCMRAGYGTEDAIQYFLDAVASFMSYNDRQCVMNLALMFEVAENKMRILNNFKKISSNKSILKNPMIANDKEIQCFRKIVTDRDNVAHGRRPYHLQDNPTSLIEYLEHSVEFINRYLELCRKQGWDRVLKMSW